MNKSSGWEEIHGFASQGEFERFADYIDRQVATGQVRTIPVDPSYGPGQLFGGRWYEDVATGEVWRLLPPDLPFRGLWEPVRRSS
jgi:hypothetical protein